MQEERWIHYNAFSGIDQSLSEHDIPLHASPDAQNMVAEGGVLKTCNGFSETGMPMLAMPVSALMKYYRNDGPDAAKEVLICVGSNGEISYLDENMQWYGICQTALPEGGFDYLNYAVGETNIIIITRDNGSPIVWSGQDDSYTTIEHEGTPFHTITLCNERVWAAGGWPNQERVWYSKAFEPTAFGGEGSGFIDMPGWRGGSITALKTFFNEVVVFKDREIFRIYGTYPGEFAVQKVEGEVGPLTHNVVVQNGDYIYFLNENGICYYDGVRARPIGDDKLKRLFENVRKDKLKKACGISFGNKVIFSLIEGNMNINNVIVEYDVQRHTYMVKRGFYASCFCVWRDRLLMGSPDGTIRYYDSGDALGHNRIDAYWTTPVTDLGAKYTTKLSSALYLLARGNGKLRVEADFGKKVKMREVELSDELKPVRMRMTNRGRTIQLKFKNVNGSRFELHQPELKIEIDED
ncbi:hypothetical protein LJC55_00205 [Eubacteriales bacterium OttesenSCG-928-N14]|nr:hypothetical protein [Eubacteriales bacterium OttesenSCG-928-N14]